MSTSSLSQCDLHRDGDDEHVIAGQNLRNVNLKLEIKRLRNSLNEHYRKRFPELIKLVPIDVDFARCVLCLGGTLPDLTAQAEKLKTSAIGLPPAIILVISVTSTSSTGQPLTLEEWDKCKDLASRIVKLSETRHALLQALQDQVSRVAPNLVALTGPEVAARLISAAGGLQELAEIPSCNVLVMGREEKFLGSAGAAPGLAPKHAGIVYDTDLVVRVPANFQRKAARLVAAKVCLAARIDRTSSGRSSSNFGSELKADVEVKIEKMLEPPPGTKTKALPTPDDGVKKKRGGRRARAIKAKFAPTELSRAQNRMAFGVPEDEVIAFDESKGLGMSSTNFLQKFKRQQESKEKQHITLSRRMQISKMLNLPAEQLANPLPASSSHTVGKVSGLASSLSFTPIQGIELVNPEATLPKKVATASKWF